MAGIHLDLHLEEEGQVAGIVPAVEGQGLHVYVGGDDLRPTGADARRMVDDHLIPLGEIDAHIFDAVFIRAGIVHAAGVHADGFFTAVVMDELVVCHEKIPLYCY